MEINLVHNIEEINGNTTRRVQPSIINLKAIIGNISEKHLFHGEARNAIHRFTFYTLFMFYLGIKCSCYVCIYILNQEAHAATSSHTVYCIGGFRYSFLHIARIKIFMSPSNR